MQENLKPLASENDNENREAADSLPAIEEKERAYYYDDAHGYQTYDPTVDRDPKAVKDKKNRTDDSAR